MLVKDKVVVNVVTVPTTVAALALMPSAKEPCVFASLSTGRTITRGQFTTLKDIPTAYLQVNQVLQERRTFAMDDSPTPAAILHEVIEVA